jgi:hypothetical protein
MSPIKKKPVIKFSSLAIYWYSGFLAAILFVMIFNLISQYVETVYYKKLFCPEI